MMTTTDITRAAARRNTRRIAWAAVLAVLLGAVAILGAQRAAPPVAVAAQDDFAGLVDIGGRRLYLECQGTGSPTVVLENGAGLGADVWNADFGERAGSQPVVAGFTRVCAYDRPGINLCVNPAVRPLAPADRLFPSRSDPVPVPRTAEAIVADLRALL